MAQHTDGYTLGPWVASGPDEFGDYNIQGSDGSLAIAAVVSNLRQPAEVQANARLIAAAPDMLEALEKIAQPQTRKLSAMDAEEVADVLSGMLQQARAIANAALIKARGGGR